MTNFLSIKQASSLKLPKFRQKYGQFLVEGAKLVDEVIHSNWQVIKIFATLNHSLEIKSTIPHQIIDDKEAKLLSQFTTPPGIVAVVEIPKFSKTLNSQNYTLVLDGINDPGNLGTIIRSADWFGINQLILSPDCVDLFNHKVVSASMGSIFRMNVHIEELNEFLRSKNTVGCFLDGVDYSKFEFTKDMYIVIGSESHGIRLQADCIKHKITIPKIGKAESLNAGVATALVLAKATGF